MPDIEAENAIREAIKTLIINGQPRNSTTVPLLAVGILRGPNPPSAEQERVYKAIDHMVARGELVASSEPWKDWSPL